MRKRLGTILLLVGSAVLVWCASVWASATLFERLEALRWNTPRPRILATVPVAKIKIAPPKPHDVIAWLDIPRLQISTAVLEGDDQISLRYGAGHIPSTPLPGAGGNVAIAAHRDTFFRALAKITPHDRIELRTPEGAYQYTVESTRVVRPANVSVLQNTSAPELTLVTCYPFRYIGPAPLRFIVRARRVDYSQRVKVGGNK
jgi:sortase A